MIDKIELETALLRPLETGTVPATTAPVVIRDYFKKSPKVKFATIWDEFKSRFFDKIENPMAEVTYRKYKLLRISALPSISLSKELQPEVLPASCRLIDWLAFPLRPRTGRSRKGSAGSPIKKPALCSMSIIAG
jgi:hypothetical protein